MFLKTVQFFSVLPVKIIVHDAPFDSGQGQNPGDDSV
jgi:hypothetical protein